MSNREPLYFKDPKAYQAMRGLENYLAQTPLTITHGELIKIRVSQINGCGYCLNMHTKDARAAGETEQRIYTLNAWRDVSFYTEEERAILALAEEMTILSAHGISDKVYNKALELLGETYLTAVIMAIVTINTWNRLAITARKQPEMDVQHV